MCVGTIIKILIGILMIFGGIYYLVGGPALSWLTGNRPYTDLLIILNGGVPIVVFLLGLFILWLELDELRIEKELKSEKKKK